MTTIANVVIAMVTASLPSVYATNLTIQSIIGPNATTIIDAINSKLRMIYDDDGQKSTDSLTTSITKIEH
ncbi:MAG TPA: hypothetical protein VH796_15065 [Nitrososphaeraceae archaeon]